MQSNFYRTLKTWIKSAAQSVAFLPLPMMVAGLLIGVGLYYFETHTEISREITSLIPSIALASQDTARNVLGLFIGGLITLMVFTFTQMMSLFNQVAASYSPRLLPYFTGDRSLQFTMGYYMGTIVLSLIVLLSIRSNEEGYIPNLSVLFCILSGIIALMMFVYFITTISAKIQSDNVIASVYERGIDYIKREEKRDDFSDRYPMPDVDSWPVISSPIDGYLGSVNHRELSRLAQRFETRFYVRAQKGEYIPKSFPILQTERPLEPEEVEEVLRNVSPIHRKFGDWYKPHLDLLVEIAMKAMSPGINDPGTALTAIDRINGLLGHLMYSSSINFCQVKDGGQVWLARTSYDKVIRSTFLKLRNYSREDTMVLRALLKMGYELLAASGRSSGLATIFRNEILAIVADARTHIVNHQDRQSIVDDIMRYRKHTNWVVYEAKYLNSEATSIEGIPLK